MYMILVYDIPKDDDGDRVLSKVFKITKKYLHHIQNSVFEGDLTPAQKQKLKNELSVHIRKNVDSVIIFEGRSDKWMKKEYWGRADDKTSNFL